MRFGDLIHLPLAALWQQKMRTFLTTLGVIFGSFVLAASLSVGQGVQEAMDRLSHRNDLLRKINVSPDQRHQNAQDTNVEVQVPGEMNDQMRERIRSELKRRKLQETATYSHVRITPEVLSDLKKLEHVEAVVPNLWIQGEGFLGERKQNCFVSSAPQNHPDFAARLVAGRCFESEMEHSVIVDEFLLYRLGIIDEAAQQDVVGQNLRLEFHSQRRGYDLSLQLTKPDDSGPTKDEAALLDKIRGQLPSLVSNMELTAADKVLISHAMKGASAPQMMALQVNFTIVGVIRLLNPDERQDDWSVRRISSDAVLPIEAAVELFYGVPLYAKNGIGQVTVVVDKESNVKAVEAKIKQIGLRTRSAIEFVDHARLMYLMIFGSMTCVATVALLVAALGIANTMLMSVLERTREIGIMKAVGASNGALQFLFLTEGALIGLVGGACGLLLAWGASFPADSWVREMISRETKTQLNESIFVFPYSLVFTVLGFSILVTTLAAVLPARRASRIDPVRALRHE
jgi:putative ABC transport system permease protein